MVRAPRSGLAGADPRVGQTLSFDGREWEVTDHSSYWNDEGYRVTEWCCETEGVEAYLLKEVKDGEPTRWFFTRSIPRAVVSGLDPGRPAAPPSALTYEGRTYRYAETTEGTYEDEPGERVPKTTWEYWDDGRQRNLAVELWGDRVDCYHGAYIDPAAVTLAAAPEGDGPAEGVGAVGVASLAGAAARLATGAKARSTGGGEANPFVTAAVILPMVYVVPFFMGRPFDECLGVALTIALLGGWLFALGRAPRAGGLALAAMAIGAYLFWTYPPLTTGAGLAMVVGGPAAVAWGGRGEAARRGRRAVLYAAAVAVGVPALAVGLHRYFWYAPAPHGLGQLVLALGPAALGGLAAVVIARLLLIGASESEGTS